MIEIREGSTTMKRIFAVWLALCLAFCFASAGAETELVSDGLTILRNHEEKSTEWQRLAVDYPVFETEDEALRAFLTEQITDPLLALFQQAPLAEESAYLNGAADTLRSGFEVSMDLPGLLSLEAAVTMSAAGSETENTVFFWRILDLEQRRSLALTDLFEEEPAEVEQAIRRVIFQNAGAALNVTEAASIPLGDSYLLKEETLNVIYAPGVFGEKSVSINIPWEVLGLEFATASSDPEEVATEPAETPAATPAPEISPLPAATLDPNFSLPPVVTPTPMPLEADDREIVQVLAHGLWKRLGTDGSVYYQFTEDGKLLIIQATDYVVQDGVLQSEIMNGTVDIGSDSAFTLRVDGESPQGYVLNRMGDAVAPAEFVTPSPTPVPTDTPAPATPAPTESPAPTPEPTPTLSPYMEAQANAPLLSVQPEAHYQKRKTQQVYSAPDAGAYREENARTDTDQNLKIYGVTENGWTLVSYLIGNGEKGRFGYIPAEGLADPENVKELRLIAMPMRLQKDCDLTDDPLQGREPLRALSAGDEVALLAFLDSQWAYVETTVEEKPCRAFILRAALMEE